MSFESEVEERAAVAVVPSSCAKVCGNRQVPA